MMAAMDRSVAWRAALLFAIALAIVADGLLVLAQRMLTPWARARRRTA